MHTHTRERKRVRERETDRQTDIETEAETERESESETESGDVGTGAAYSESDGTFSTDADGTPIYTDKNGNTTPNVDGYQYTDEDGKVITDGYGYIDPYTGAYILK